MVDNRIYDLAFVQSKKRKPKASPAMEILRNAVTWRNDEIGHGALGRKSDYLHGVVATQAAVLSELLAYVEPLSALRLVAKFNGAELDLTGATLPEAVLQLSLQDVASTELHLHRRADRRAVALHPLVLLETSTTGEPGVLLFDKRVFARGGQPKADVYLDYEAGSKTVMASIPMCAVTESTGLTVDGEASRLAESLASDRSSYSASLHERVQRLRLGLDEVHNFVVPHNVIAQLRGWFESTSRGYLHITGPAGVGKSWLAGNLHRADVLGEDYADCVLTFHAGFGSAQSQAAFVSELNAQALQRFDRMQAVLAEERAPELARERLARFLSDLAATSSDGEVVLVVDGLDEVVDVPGRDVSILDFLPDVEALADGVYVVLLSRPMADMGGCGKSCVNRLKASAASDDTAWTTLAIDPESAQQAQLVATLVDARLSGEAAELRSQVERLSGGIPLRAAHLCTLVKMSSGQALDHVGGSFAALYGTYFMHLERRIGPTWFARVYRPLISVLSVAREPLELGGLAEILNVSPEHVFLASLDLADCIRTRRFAGESSVFLEVNHLELRQFVRDEHEMWEEGHKRLGQCFSRWWRDEWLAEPDSRIEHYAARFLPVHLVGAGDEDGLADVLTQTLRHETALGLSYLETLLSGLLPHERLVAMDAVRSRLELLDGVLGRVHDDLRGESVCADSVLARVSAQRIHAVDALSSRFAHTAPARAVELLRRATDLIEEAVARGETSPTFETSRAVFSYRLHECFRTLGRPQEARASLVDALTLREHLAASAEDVRERRSQLSALVWCQIGMTTFADTTESDKVARLERAQSILLEMEQLGVETPEVEDMIARTQGVVAASLAAVRPTDRADLLGQAVAAYQRAQKTSPDDRFLDYSLASTQRYLANALLERDQEYAARGALSDAERAVAALFNYELMNPSYIRLDAHLRRLRSRLKLREGDRADATARMRDACQRIEAAGSVMKSSLVQREVEDFRKELATLEEAGREDE